MRLLITLLAGATLMLGVACSRGGATTPTTGNTEPSSGSNTSQGQQASGGSQGGQTSASGAQINEADVRKLAEAWAAAKSYRVKLSGSATADGQAIDGTIEVVKPDRMRMKFTNRGQSFELIRIGSDSYTNVGGRWVKSPIASTGLDGLTPDPDKIVKDFSESKNSGDVPRKGDTVTIEGVQCQEWVMKDGSICVGTRDNLPRRFAPTGGNGVTLIFTDWNSSITISPPV